MIGRLLAEFAVSSRETALPDDVATAATRAIVDWHAATIVGSRAEPTRILREAFGGPNRATGAHLVPSGPRIDPVQAALINGSAAHAAELDDIFRHGLYHPGAPTIAAALAVAQHRQISGRELLQAVAVGYEIGDRVAAALQPAHYVYWHTTGTVGAIGAAAAAAEAQALGIDAFTHALTTSATMAAGLQQAFRSDAMSKPLHAGQAAANGVTAAIAAAHGLTGARDVFEGPVGLGAAMSEDVDWESAISILGEPWAITETTVKRHSCCGHTFAAVDAALELRAAGVTPSSTDHILVRTYSTAITVAGNADPSSVYEAKFSLAFCVAAAMVEGTVGPGVFTDGRLADPSIRALMDRIVVEPDPEFDADFPGRRRARVIVTTRDGSRHTVVRNTRRGDPDDPLTDAELRAKFEDLTVPVIGEQEAHDLATRLWNLRDVNDVNELGGPTWR